MIAWLGMAALVLSAPPARRALSAAPPCSSVSSLALRSLFKRSASRLKGKTSPSVTQSVKRSRGTTSGRVLRKASASVSNARGAGAIGIKAACSSPTATTPTPARPHGKQQFWHPNRRKKKTAHYDEGILDGSYTTPSCQRDTLRAKDLQGREPDRCGPAMARQRSPRSAWHY